MRLAYAESSTFVWLYECPVVQGFHGCEDAGMDTQSKPKGRPMWELTRLVAEDNARFDQLEELWHELTVSEQEELVKTARAMVEGGG